MESRPRELVAKVAEVIDRPSAIVKAPRTFLASHAAKHRGGVDDEIVLFEVEHVGRKCLEASTETFSLQIAGDDGELGLALEPVSLIEEVHERRLRHLRLESRKFVGLGAAFDQLERRGLKDRVQRIVREGGMAPMRFRMTEK